MSGSANGEASPGPEEVANRKGGTNTAAKCTNSKKLNAMRQVKRSWWGLVSTVSRLLTMVERSPTIGPICSTPPCTLGRTASRRNRHFPLSAHYVWTARSGQRDWEIHGKKKPRDDFHRREVRSVYYKSDDSYRAAATWSRSKSKLRVWLSPAFSVMVFSWVTVWPSRSIETCTR